MTRPVSLPTLLLMGALVIPFAAESLYAAPPPPRTGQRTMEGGIGVARATAVIGDVTRRHGGTKDVSRLSAGTPLLGGDSVMAGPASRAEVRLDSSNFIRLDGNTEILLRELGERSFQINVVRGTVSYTMLRGGEADVDLETPNANVVPQKNGVYRVQVRDKNDSLVIVRDGEAQVLTPDRSVVVKKGKSMIARKYAHGERAEIASAPSKDAFDEWNHRRDDIMKDERGPVYARGWYPGRVHLGVGWGWDPYWSSFWGPYWGPYWGAGWGYYAPTVVIRGGGFGHRGGGEVVAAGDSDGQLSREPVPEVFQPGTFSSSAAESPSRYKTAFG